MKKYFYILCVLLITLNISAFKTYAVNDGTIDTGFVDSINSLINDNWEDNYFSCISFTIGADKMDVDGEERPMTPAVLEDGNLMLPVTDMANVVGADVNIDKKTGQITVIDDEEKAIIVPAVEEETRRSQKGGPREFTVRDDGSVEGSYSDGTKFTRKPWVTAERAEKSLNIDVIRGKNNVMIIRPFQLKQLVVQMKDNASLYDTFGAQDFVTDGAGLYLLQYRSVRAAKSAFDRFSEISDVEFAVPNRIVKTESLSWGTERIAAELFKTKLISENKTQNNINVAVIDTGVDTSHPFLSGRIADDGYDFIDNDTVPEDISGHGTHIAGIIADCSTSNVKVAPVKALNNEGKGNTLTIYLSIKYAADKGARVINMSFGTYDKDPHNLIAQAVDYATGKGCVCVAAAGNEARDVIDMCPANLPDAISVAAVDQSDLPASFSNYGAGIDVAAPGVNIYSCMPRGGYASLSGTSMAAPHVTASAAMLLLDNRTLSPSGVRDSLKYITKHAGSSAIYGIGIVDFRAYFENSGKVTEEYTELPFMNGYPGGNFQPDADLSRAEAAQTIYNILGPGIKDDLGRLSGFNDIDSFHWAADAFAWVITRGYFMGSGNGALRPDDPITRAELSAVLYRAAQKENLPDEAGSQSINFNDINGHWAYDNIMALAQKGIIIGYEDGLFKPENNVTRAETVAMIARLFNRTNEFRPNITFSDVPQTHWAYEYIMNAVNGRSILIDSAA